MEAQDRLPFGSVLQGAVMQRPKDGQSIPNCCFEALVAAQAREDLAAPRCFAAADLADERPVDLPVQRFHSDGLFLTQYGGWKNHRGQRVRTSELFKDKRGSEARNI